MAALEQLLADHLRVLGVDHPHTLPIRRHLAEWQQPARVHRSPAGESR